MGGVITLGSLTLLAVTLKHNQAGQGYVSVIREAQLGGRNHAGQRLHLAQSRGTLLCCRASFIKARQGKKRDKKPVVSTATAGQ